jgi:hypothetical protein
MTPPSPYDGDTWAWIELPLDEVRQRLNILPKG